MKVYCCTLDGAELESATYFYGTEAAAFAAAREATTPDLDGNVAATGAAITVHDVAEPINAEQVAALLNCQWWSDRQDTVATVRGGSVMLEHARLHQRHLH